MQTLSKRGTQLRDELSQRHGVSAEAVQVLIDAVARGGGWQAQFSHPELGGMGQWSAGGMTMVGDMFNTGLQGLVANLCAEIAQALANGDMFDAAAATASGAGQSAPGEQPRPHSGQSQFQGQTQGGSLSGGIWPGSSGGWWPAELGQPSSTGSQNALSYAIFPDKRRLAVNLEGTVTVYDTGDHLIGGVSQQQSGGASWTFTSQHGTVPVQDLPVVPRAETAAGATVGTKDATPGIESGDAPDAAVSPGAGPGGTASQRTGQDGDQSIRPDPAGNGLGGTPDGTAGSAPGHAGASEPAPSHGAPDTAASAGRPDAGTQGDRPARPAGEAAQSQVVSGADAIFAALEKLAALREIGILTDEEFAAKKAELLLRL